MSIIEQIKNEIERRITDNTFGAKLELIDLLSWLDSSFEEKSEKPKKFEDELKDYLRRYYNCDYPMQIEENTCSPTMPHIVEAARHFAQWGAEWQAKQDQETIELAEDHAYLAGSVNEREQMMKEAVEYEVGMHGEPIEITLDKYVQRARGIFPGDKVRVIVLPKEDSHDTDTRRKE